MLTMGKVTLQVYKYSLMVFFIDTDVFTPNLDEQDIRKTQLLNWSSKLPLEQKMLFFRTEKRVNFSIYSYLFCY